MPSNFSIMKWVWVVSLTFLIMGCAQGPNQIQRAVQVTSEPTLASIQAVYLVNGAGELSGNDIQAHPEVVVARSFDAFKNYAHAKVALWIDRNAVGWVDQQWLHQTPQKYYPLVLVGYHNALYSFRDVLKGFGIIGPYVDWSTETLEPGFSIWMITEDKENSVSAVMQGYDEPPTVQRILGITNALLPKSLAR